MAILPRNNSYDRHIKPKKLCKIMLIEFKVKNFRSFKDEQTFSMVASPDSSLSDNYLANPAFPRFNILKSAVIYGANASGKTNLIKALAFVEGFVCNSHRKKIGSKIEVEPFLLEDAGAEVSFELTFVHQNVRYRYGFVVDETHVVEESLYAYPSNRSQMWFERVKDQVSDKSQEISYNWNFGSSLKGESRRIAAQTRSNVLFLSKAADSNHKQLSQVYDWFNSCLDTFLDIREFPPTITAQLANENPVIKETLAELINIADLGITDFEAEEKELLKEDMPEDMPENMREALHNLFVNRKGWKISMIHSTKNLTVTRSFSLMEESMGTQRLFAFGGIIIKALLEGRVLVVDELDSSLHPLLSKMLVKLFNDKASNPKGAQLIFNTHDTTLLDTENLFRRDQIWLVEKDADGASHLYPLSDFKPRIGEAIQKNYIQGRYGAVPMIQEPLQIG